MIVCVLKTGGMYGPEHVERLRRQVAENCISPVLCLTDHPDLVRDVESLPLRANLPGWWSKLEALRLPGPILYLDLDVAITGDLTPLLHACWEHELIVCRDFLHPELGLNSSVMAWRDDLSGIYDAFVDVGPERIMVEYTTRQRWGDQAFIRDYLTFQPAYWQDLLPGYVMSYKGDVLAGRPTDEARVIVFHGQPKPWDLAQVA